MRSDDTLVAFTHRYLRATCDSIGRRQDSFIHHHYIILVYYVLCVHIVQINQRTLYY